MSEPAPGKSPGDRARRRADDFAPIPEGAADAWALLERGNHVAARAAANTLLSSDDGEVRESARRLVTSLRPDRWTLTTAAVTLLFFAGVGFQALLPHGHVKEARALVEAVGASDLDTVRAAFTDRGWDAGGRDFVSQFASQRGRVFEQPERARELGYVMIDFPGAAAEDKNARRYLVFDEQTHRVGSVRRNPPRKQ